MPKRRHRSEAMATLQAIGHELKTNPPSILEHTRRKFGAKRAGKQRQAILLNKARRAGARIPPAG